MTKAMETKKMGLNENEEEQDNQAKDNEVEVCTDDEERNADEDNNEDSNEETHDEQDDMMRREMMGEMKKMVRQVTMMTYK